ncbi:hypothetical protein AA0119_g13130 [Alternaria tenuissima]|uniref:Uncharacterized protein n=3 Tax=Alternaria sect. Alternaria TaxID=2499237 RepID=A0A4Q4MWD1_ALTAL|nr:hypothetical protein AG0111_0g11817 [Alternaria gaisen]RYN61611.1 hypothetical protein AA0117_g12981 [Alternaria alternata]RYN85784.1 hypothetical protein AA0119_g13130 [Alternaria tenuissima]RYO03582.1 hypothetical protein AA0121_g13022 [Alternaria tenuissima]RYO47947.1 hypothetical protein AA0116_g12889 [Alternaria tenuissima]
MYQAVAEYCFGSYKGTTSEEASEKNVYRTHTAGITGDRLVGMLQNTKIRV